ncbi:hypothetical protein P7K49_039419 [Saguinus oedipus]|uniref:Uncharacterized protein n=1 Tax=Saguinus oedipus TaxID=9490 RepID=A0ABQ9TBT2_SAGOE|nr:hypothetical protein P7K49_039419 [Saguinus oedipus]
MAEPGEHQQQKNEKPRVPQSGAGDGQMRTRRTEQNPRGLSGVMVGGSWLGDVAEPGEHQQQKNEKRRVFLSPGPGAGWGTWLNLESTSSKKKRKTPRVPQSGAGDGQMRTRRTEQNPRGLSGVMVGGSWLGDVAEPGEHQQQKKNEKRRVFLSPGPVMDK